MIAVFWHTKAVFIHLPQSIFRPPALTVGFDFQVPIRSLSIVLRNDLSGIVDGPEHDLRTLVTLLCGFAKPINSSLWIVRSPPPLLVHYSQHELRICIA